MERQEKEPDLEIEDEDEEDFEDDEDLCDVASFLEANKNTSNKIDDEAMKTVYSFPFQVIC